MDEWNREWNILRSLILKLCEAVENPDQEQAQRLAKKVGRALREDYTEEFQISLMTDTDIEP